MVKLYQELLDGNRRWIDNQHAQDPNYFRKLARGQSPEYLWIGCADSRVPANEVTDTPPGAIFVHRNIANMVVHSDFNMLSVLEYAVQVLKVKHVIVCGHFQCGGIRAALSNKQFGLIDNWLRHIKDVCRLHREELDAIGDLELKERRLTELNVWEQVFNLGKTSTIQEAWQKTGYPQIHGWVIDIETGLIVDQGVTIRDNSELHEIYRFDTD
jgi:carbonic anhydrase